MSGLIILHLKYTFGLSFFFIFFSLLLFYFILFFHFSKSNRYRGHALKDSTVFYSVFRLFCTILCVIRFSSIFPPFVTHWILRDLGPHTGHPVCPNINLLGSLME